MSEPERVAGFESVRGTALAARGRLTWIQKLVALLLLVVLLGIAGALVVWGLIVAAVIVAIAAVMFGVAAIRRALTGERSLRRNVRIIRR